MKHMFALPWPPSVNHYFLNAARKTKTGKVYMARMLSKEAIAFRAEVVRAVRAGHRSPPKLSGRLSVMMLACPPDHRESDIDNRIKAALDAMQQAEVFINDQQFDEVTIFRGNYAKGGRLLVSISSFDPDEAAVSLNKMGLPAPWEVSA